MNLTEKKLLLEEFYNYLSEKRKNLFLEKIKHRTNFIAVVLEDIYQSQNASAVLRTSECLGIQDIHIVENNNKYQINPDVSLGSDKWINLHYYKKKNENNTITCIEKLKSDGYKIIATHPHKNEISLSEYIPKEKIALVFGTEKEGISEDIKNAADHFLTIPMYGFTESYNISVAAAITLFSLVEKIKKEKIWKGLDEKEETEILLKWCRKSIRMSKKIEESFLKKM